MDLKWVGVMGGREPGPTSSSCVRGLFSLLAFAFPTLRSEEYKLSPLSLDK